MIGLGLPCPTERALEVCGLQARSPVGELVPAALGRFAVGTQHSGGAGGDEFEAANPRPIPTRLSVHTDDVAARSAPELVAEVASAPLN